MKRLFFILITSLLTLNLFSQYNWQLVKNQNGIKVYTKSVPGYTIKKCKTETIINAPIEKVYNIIRDVKNAPQWVDNVVFAKEIETGKDYYICYEIIKIGYGLKDRDIVTYETIHRFADGSIKITITSAADKYPRQKGKVRIEKVQGYWLLRPLSKNKTLLTYEFFSDPKNIPQWIINAFITDSPYNTIAKLREIAE